MVFGQNVTYLYGEVYKDKFSTPKKAYKIDPLAVDCSACPARVIDDQLEIFFAGPIFNTYVTSVEDKVAVLKSYDDKLTVTKDKVEKNKLYTVKIIKENEKVREVELYKFDELFPGYRTQGEVEIKNDNVDKQNGHKNTHKKGDASNESAKIASLDVDESEAIVTTPKATGRIILQNNTPKPITDCVLYKIEKGKYEFVEINNPIQRCVVKVVKDLKNNKIVESGNIKGLLIGATGNKDTYSVYVKKVCLGTYVFIEDLVEGKETVELIGKRNGVYEVKFKGFVGTCEDKKVSKVMKGSIYDIKGNTFKFRRDEDQSGVPIKRTADFEEVEVVKRIEITSEDQIENDQHRAIEYIKRQIEKKLSGPSILGLFRRYIAALKEKDDLCLFYLNYLNTNKMLSPEDVNEMIKSAGQNFIHKITDHFSEKDVLQTVFKKKKTKKCFGKLLPVVDDKIRFMRENPEFMETSIQYAYKSMQNPRVIVEGFIDQSYNNWMVYLKNENGEYKRGLFRRMVSMKFKPNEIKNIFKLWLEFEENCHGNVGEVQRLAQEYVNKQQNTQ